MGQMPQPVNVSMESKLSIQLEWAVKEIERLTEVANWAQAILTAINVGDVKSGSMLHLKLREVMIQSRESR